MTVRPGANKNRRRPSILVLDDRPPRRARWPDSSPDGGRGRQRFALVAEPHNASRGHTDPEVIVASLLDMVQQNLGPNEINQISQQLGVDPGQAQSAISAALPMMVGGMANHASQPGGADAIQQSLSSHGGILGNLGALLGGGGPADGGGLLGQVLGQHQVPVQQGVSQASGLDSEKTRKLLLMLAPIVMGVLARRQAASQSNPAQVGEELKRESQTAQQQAQVHAPQLGGLLGQIFKGF
jgi:hypothetical protein